MVSKAEVDPCPLRTHKWYLCGAHRAVLEMPQVVKPLAQWRHSVKWSLLMLPVSGIRTGWLFTLNKQVNIISFIFYD